MNRADKQHRVRSYMRLPSDVNYRWRAWAAVLGLDLNEAAERALRMWCQHLAGNPTDENREAAERRGLL